MAIMNPAKAGKARQRMAKRAKRSRFWKENKKRLTIIILAFLAVVFVVFFTPLGPDYYRAKIEERKMETSRNVAAGAIKDLYNLGVFYQYTMRKPKALEVYDEIGRLFFGHKLVEYAMNPERVYERRLEMETNVKRGTSSGPPFVVPDSDIPYVALAIWRVGEIIQFDRSKHFAYNLYNDLYLEEMGERYPHELDPEVTALVQAYCDRFRGAR